MKKEFASMPETFAEHYDESKLGRYGKTGFIYNVHAPRNPDTGQAQNNGGGLGVITVMEGTNL